MRSADLATIIRIALILFVAYLILVQFNVIITIALLALAFILDGVDGYLALREASKGKVTLAAYIDYSLGGKANAAKIKSLKQGIGKTAKHGPRFDFAGDRIMEYTMWVVFSFLAIVPVFVVLIVIIRHSVADALMASKGTSSKMKTPIARALTSSSFARGAKNVLKFVTFSYLILVYSAGFPILPGYVLVAALVALILASGAAEIYESVKS
jgi:phosphatidylglycerophosphate synthase